MLQRWFKLFSFCRQGRARQLDQLISPDFTIEVTVNPDSVSHRPTVSANTSTNCGPDGAELPGGNGAREREALMLFLMNWEVLIEF